ncbi:Zinc finger protein 689, partial [Lemmus lemmus]
RSPILARTVGASFPTHHCWSVTGGHTLVSALTFVTSVANVFPRGRTCLSTRSYMQARNPYHCPDYGRCCRGSRSLAHHQTTHKGEKPHQCSSCGHRFAYPSLLAIHQRTHRGEKSYPCPDCGHRFAYPSLLASHRRVHSGERPYACDLCSKRFAQWSHLAQHQLLHTGEKPFPCLECGLCFRQRWSLVVHKCSHRGPGQRSSTLQHGKDYGRSLNGGVQKSHRAGAILKPWSLAPHSELQCISPHWLPCSMPRTVIRRDDTI